jgi:transcriptional regulator with XRE-family HTH domain
MSLQWMTIASGIRQLWPGRYNRTLAERLGVPRATAKAWLAGRRRMPIPRMRAMADVLRHDLAVGRTALDYLEVEIARRDTSR